MPGRFASPKDFTDDLSIAFSQAAVQYDLSDEPHRSAINYQLSLVQRMFFSEDWKEFPNGYILPLSYLEYFTFRHQHFSSKKKYIEKSFISPEQVGDNILLHMGMAK